ncbi:cardiolipin synthase [Tindallia californiensis]|nr:cardiolipin synthase [Tindallia californiensis]
MPDISKRSHKTLRILRKMLMPRTFFLMIALLGQMIILTGVISRFNQYFAQFYAFSLFLSLVVFLWVMNSQINPAYKIAWIIPILLFPIFGGLFYLFLGRSRMSRKVSQRMKAYEMATMKALMRQRSKSEDYLRQIEDSRQDAAIQARYINHYAGYPLYPEQYNQYLDAGEVKFEKLLEELEKAERYIFMEYFIIEEGLMWNRILEILKKKADAGVDVRLIYDDVGCLFTLPHGYDKKMEEMGIKCCIFNPLVPVLSLRQNNRDHRKITVIDGTVAFTGGINLADEYINKIEKFGHWKDTAILMKGESVWSFTVMFLSMWDYLRDVSENFEQFKPRQIPSKDQSREKETTSKGYIQPFADSPLDQEPVSETVYLNLIYRAQKYVYITTPYLILANEMVTALCAAAKGGVDVRIITPHKWDKRLVHAVTRTFYKALIQSGVKIYEYTPGFMHSKTFVVDDHYAVVGTINMDYRSLYLHFECGVWMFDTECIAEMKNDFTETLKVCQRVTMEEYRERKWYKVLTGSILRIFAPML